MSLATNQTNSLQASALICGHPSGPRRTLTVTAKLLADLNYFLLGEFFLATPASGMPQGPPGRPSRGEKVATVHFYGAT